jgi:hypothetical protein
VIVNTVAGVPVVDGVPAVAVIPAVASGFYDRCFFFTLEDLEL